MIKTFKNYLNEFLHFLKYFYFKTLYLRNGGYLASLNIFSPFSHFNLNLGKNFQKLQDSFENLHYILSIIVSFSVSKYATHVTEIAHDSFKGFSHERRHCITLTIK